MHIAHFTNYYHPVVNGVVRSISAFRKSLFELGHTVFIFAQGAPDYADQEPFIFRYPMIKLPLQVEVTTAIPISPFVDRLLPPLKLDVIHTHHPFLLGQVAASKAEELDIPLVFTFHTRYRDYTHYFPIPQEIVQDFVKTAIHTWLAEFIQQCNHVIVPSESMRDVLVSEYGIENQLTAIPTGIDLQPYQGLDPDRLRRELGWGDDFVLISAGRLVPEKNWKTLIQAAGLARDAIPNLRVVILGDGPEKKDLKKLAQEVGLGDGLELPGKVAFDQVPRYLKAAHCFGFASITETQGLVTMEGLAAGLPVIAVDATGTRDVLQHEVQGLLTENKSEALAAGIRKIYQEQDFYEKLRGAATQRAREFDQRKLTERMVKVYQVAREDHKAGKKVKVTRQESLFSLDILRPGSESGRQGVAPKGKQS